MVEGKPSLGKSQRSGGDGVPEVLVVDEQQDFTIDLERWRVLALDTLRHCGVRGGAELTVMFVDENAMTELNSDFMGKTGPTDVLAFPLDGVEVAIASGPGSVTRGPSRSQFDVSDLPLLLGDVVVCPKVAGEQAPTHAGNLDDELALLIVHGILHVLGHDHDTDEATVAMRALERQILEEHHWHGSTPENFRQDQPE